MKFCGHVRCVTRKIFLDFGEDQNPDPTTTILWVILHHWSGQKWYIAQYLKTLWTDLDETWWTGWLSRLDKLIRFWWRFDSGSGYEHYLIFKLILHHWEIGPKTTYHMLFQKCIGPDVFSWIRHDMAEGGTLRSALPVLESVNKLWYITGDEGCGQGSSKLCVLLWKRKQKYIMGLNHQYIPFDTNFYFFYFREQSLVHHERWRLESSFIRRVRGDSEKKANPPFGGKPRGPLKTPIFFNTMNKLWYITVF